MFNIQILCQWMRGAANLIKRKPGLLLLVVLAVVFKAVSDRQTTDFSYVLRSAASKGYFSYDWKGLLEYIRSNLGKFLLIVTATNLAASYLSLCSFAITEDAALQKDRSAIFSASRVGVPMVLVDLLFRAAASIIIGLSVLPVYFLLKWIHAPDAALIALAAFLIPLWFGATACFSFLLQRSDPQNAMQSLQDLSFKNIILIYTYYASRMLLEAALVGSMTLLISKVCNAGEISSIIGALVLVLPLSFFRVSGVLLKQTIFGAPAAPRTVSQL